MKKIVCVIIAISCAITIFGAAGTCDAGNLSPLEALKICVFAVPALGLSLEIGGFIE